MTGRAQACRARRREDSLGVLRGARLRVGVIGLQHGVGQTYRRYRPKTYRSYRPKLAFNLSDLALNLSE